MSIALVVLLERLGPEERVAFLLREVFDADDAEIAALLERSEAAAWQMVHRARERVQAGRARFAVSPGTQERLLQRLMHAIAAEDKDAVVALFTEHATFTGDGGGRVPAARRVLIGPERIARFLLGLQRKYGAATTHSLCAVNGAPAMVTELGGVLVGVTSFATDGVRISAAYRVLNPAKLARFYR
ncbi:MAG TPA: sigma factor-like helix-turn-helix DNA-binding protein [Gemmatimonadaceae bacterium]|nr:sigma factor-like helix-turn-helix DNA-binding protein [Gemmatimonadaceae bacterium]